MYLSELKLWNFRKYSNSDGSIELGHPHLTVPFKKGLNVLIGENDSGKTSIIDAIKLVMKTHAYEWIRVSYDDFAIGTNKLRIELIISDLSVQEASHFIEWLGWTGEKVHLRLVYGAMIRDGKIIPTDIGAGETEGGNYLSFEAKEYLKTLFYVTGDAPTYQMTDIMAGIRYLLRLSEELVKPLVICLGLGTSQGDHSGDSPLDSMLSVTDQFRGINPL